MRRTHTHTHRLKEFHSRGSSKALSKLRHLAAQLWGDTTQIDRASESREEAARMQFCKGASSQYNANSSMNRLGAVTKAAGPLHDYVGGGRGPRQTQRESWCTLS